MDINLKLRVDLFSDKMPMLLLLKLVDMFKDFANENNFKPILLIVPQKDDVEYIKNNEHFYKGIVDQIKKSMTAIDMYDIFSLKNLNQIYSDDNKYGGHPNQYGNQLIAQEIQKVVR
jgi:lysophospholipase L1-like esterase